jgi:S1-C subfamily serine protease
VSNKGVRKFLLVCFNNALAVAVIAIVVIAPSTVAGVFTGSPSAPAPVAQQNSALVLNLQTETLKTIFRQVEGSVVQITRSVPAPSLSSQQTENGTALGSGFISDKIGHIITNNHVVGNAKLVDVTFIDGNRYTANVTGTDPYSDIAVLKIIENKNNNTIQQQLQKLRPLVLGNSSDVEVGDRVVAIGNPYGLDGTMTTGIVSQLGRLVPSPNPGFSIPDIIQTDAAVNPGNSGGPLLNMQGHVIGINFAALQGGGLGFAIPSNLINKVVPMLIEKGNYIHPYLGFDGTTLTSDLAANLGNAARNLKGIFVNTVVKGGPADKAGLQGTTIDQYGQKHGGDVIIAVDRQNTTQLEDLISYMEKNKSAGDTVILTAYRNGHTLVLNVVLGGRLSLIP